MGRIWIALGITCALVLVTGSAFAQGRSGKEHPKGKSAAERLDAAQAGAEETAGEQVEAAVSAADEAADEAQEAASQRDRREDAERPEHAASASPGFFDRVRGFFGWERSQERMSEQGKAHQQATQQERGPKKER
jgi:hypothetical protein